MFLEEVNNRPRAPPAASYFSRIDMTSERVTQPRSVCLHDAFREPFPLFSGDVQVTLWTEDQPVVEEVLHTTVGKKKYSISTSTRASCTEICILVKVFAEEV